MSPTNPDISTQSAPDPAVRRVAIIGCGPSGCFTAQALRKKMPDLQITIFDALPTPYGLIRHGIAPDHQGAKAVHHQFDRLFNQPNVSFVGNTAIGSDVPMQVLLDGFHAVVYATGLPRDRSLGVTPESGTRVLGAGALLRLLNSDPDSALRRHPGGVPELGERIAIVGTGNVAADVARLLTKSVDELTASDIDDQALATLLPRRLRSIDVIGRCERTNARWDAGMVAELARVHAVDLRMDGQRFDPDLPVVPDPTVIDVHFRQTVQAIKCNGYGTRLITSDTEDAARLRTFDVDTVISAVGFEPDPSLFSDAGVGDPPHVFHVGGRASGSLGNLAENRKLAAAIAKEIVDYLCGDTGRTPGIDDIGPHLPPHHVGFDEWQHIDNAETARARPGRCRTKFTTRDELLSVAKQSTTAADGHQFPPGETS